MSWDAYLAAHVEVDTPAGRLRVMPERVGVASGPFPDAARRTVHIVTAHNPNGRTRDVRLNARAHGHLLAALDVPGVSYLPARGGDATWRHVEESVAVVGMDDDQARSLGRAFSQDAIFAWRPDAWMLLSCTDDRFSIQGWHSHVLDDPSAAR